MGDHNSFILYTDMRQPLALLTDEQRGKLLLALFDYAETGSVPFSSEDGALSMAFSFIQQTLDRDAVKWENERKKRSEAGKKGAEATNSKRWQCSAKVGNAEMNAAKSSVSVSENVTVNESDNVSESVRISSETRTRSQFEPPSVDDVKAFAEENGLVLNAGAFCDYYAARGWHMGNVPMVDWKAAARAWERRESKDSASAPSQPPRNDLARAERLLAKRKRGAADE